MRFRIPASAFFLLVAFALSAASGIAQPNLSARPVQTRQLELAFTYNWAHSNAPPGGCGCFNLNGAGLQLALPVGKKGFNLAGDFAIVHQPDAVTAGNSLTLSTFLAVV